ncbi:MAG: octaprenyl diphosphate synthase [Proteobacteria bacterium]|nr:octaprenyl diphosphate synthase [Pseudomonadota bacterium]
MQLDAIRELLADDMAATDRLIREKLSTDVVLIDQVANYIINSGGKRLRPLVVVAAGRACGCPPERQVAAAAIIEFIHTATLLHDDVVDESAKRRGRDTANEVWGNQASVLVGDFLYSRSFQMMVEIGEPEVMRILADATNTIAEGEVLQLINCGNPETTEQQYLDVIFRKTAKLFEAGTRIAAILAGRDEKEQQAMAEYGRHLGTAFQLVDDVLDYSASTDALGKNIGDDLAEGKPTLPLIHAMRKGSEEQSELIRLAITQGGLDKLDEVLAAIESTGALDYTSKLAVKAAETAKQALTAIPESPYRDALAGLADFSVARAF